MVKRLYLRPRVAVNSVTWFTVSPYKHDLVHNFGPEECHKKGQPRFSAVDRLRRSPRLGPLIAQVKLVGEYQLEMGPAV